MSGVVMRDSDEEGQVRDNEAVQNPSSYNFCGFEHFEVAPLSKKKTRKGQLQRNSDASRHGIEKQFNCIEPGCTRTFTSRFKLMRHKLIHSGERRFQCPSCGRRFHRKDHLKNHLQVHNPNKLLHSCQLCRKTYCSLLSYRKHLALHSAEAGDPVCKLCGRMFSDRDKIMHHLKVHTGSRTLRGPSERKFPCDRCDRSFFTKKDVKRHLVVHTGKRDFVCQFCPQRFGRKDHLVRHTKKSHVAAVATNTPPTDGLQKYDSHPSLPSDNLKGVAPIVPSSLSDVTRSVMPSSAAPALLEPVPVSTIKHEATYMSATPNLIQPNFGMSHMGGENGQNLGRFGESTLLPVSQYLPMSPPYPGITPILPHTYLNTMSTSTNMLSGLGSDVLPPMTVAPAFPTTVSLDLGNPSLPHFSQAFQ